MTQPPHLTRARRARPPEQDETSASSGEPPNGTGGGFPIVGVGASAGGLQALESFLRQVPDPCPMAFVIVQHLSPAHTGNLPELLQRYTHLPVLQVDNTTVVQPGHVYVISPNKDLEIHQRTLVPHDLDEQKSHGLRLPINTFLNSLARDCGPLGVGVILSGMGSDGSEGLCAIHEQGGLTLAQSDAKFDSMPQSAILAHRVDIALPADAMVQHILKVTGAKSLDAKAQAVNADLPHSSFERITGLLKQKTRHDFSLYKPTSLYRRIERRMGIHKLDSTEQYADLLQSNGPEVELLFKELLIGVTNFFRDPVMWDELRTQAMPKILAGYPEGGALRAWSCGCSTGEEAYSLAITFKEALDAVPNPAAYSLQIFATDLDIDAIEKARQGHFDRSIEADVSAERLKRFFVKDESGYRINKDTREMVTFAQQNVTMDPPFTRIDVLLCRNLLIYFSAELQKKLLPLFHYSLKPGGLLFLGSAETVGSQHELFSMLNNQSKLYWRKDANARGGVIAFPSFSLSHAQSAMPMEPYTHKSADNLQALADRLILQLCSSPAVLTTAEGDVVYVSGKTGKYLEPAAGKANMNIFAMAREGLRYEMGSAFAKAARQQEPVTVRGNLVEGHQPHQAVDMVFVKIDEPQALNGLVLITFKDVVLPPKVRRRKTALHADGKQLEQMEQELLISREELRVTREEMQTTNEELKATNEELQSTNEELQSTNEELTTSKEEMQSMNEELQSVNAELSTRLEDFLRINNDMENLLNSTEVVTVFLDNQLQVRRYTTGAHRLFKLIPGDVGRPLTDIVSDLNYPELYDDVQDVLRRLMSVEKKVTSLDGRSYMVRIMPYRTMEKVIDGVVITCVDVTAAIKMEADLQERITQLESKLAS